MTPDNAALEKARTAFRFATALMERDIRLHDLTDDEIDRIAKALASTGAPQGWQDWYGDEDGPDIICEVRLRGGVIMTAPHDQLAWGRLEEESESEIVAYRFAAPTPPSAEEGGDAA